MNVGFSRDVHLFEQALPRQTATRLNRKNTNKTYKTLSTFPNDNYIAMYNPSWLNIFEGSFRRSFNQVRDKRYALLTLYSSSL